MSSTITCHVDTSPMAESIGSVSNHVNGTTAAVVAMKAAVVKAESDAANHVCDKVNRGFYTLIRSQISQKIASLKSEVDSHLMRLNQQRKQLTAIRERMQRDYNMISARYLKTFTTINKNLEQRVAELDRPVMDLAGTEAGKVTNRAARLTADIPLGQIESVRTSQMIGSSRLKFTALKAIETIERFIDGSNRLEEVTDRILLRRRMNPETTSVSRSIPVVITETNYDPTDMSQTQTYISRMELSAEATRSIEGAIDSVIRSQQLPWVYPQAGIPAELVSEFRSLVNASGIDPRRQRMMVAMFESHPFQTLEMTAR
ncbi:MAG: hypothetical protein K2L97_06295 [Muribaculaceae bacterium]|nr:hypothetical protein [Muribaculaceae bacterium]